MGNAAPPTPFRAILDLGDCQGAERAAFESALGGELRELVVLGGLENGAGSALNALKANRTLESLELRCAVGMPPDLSHEAGTSLEEVLRVNTVLRALHIDYALGSAPGACLGRGLAANGALRTLELRGPLTADA